MHTFRKRIQVLLFAAVFGVCTNEVLAQSAQSDFDGDGLSDITLIDIQEDDDLRWLVRSSETQVLSPLTTFGRVGDHIALGRWISTTEPDVAVIRKPEDGDQGVWRLRLDNGIRSRTFGDIDGLFMAGADFDGSGLADGAVVTVENGSLTWNIWQDILAEEPGSQNQISFGKGVQGAFFLNPDGTRDWLAVSQYLSKRNRLRLSIRDTQSSQVRRINLAVAERVGRPVPIAASDGRDNVLLYRKAGGVYRVFVFALNGQRIFKGKLRGKGDLIVGNFTSDPGEEMAVQAGATFRILNPVTAARSELQLENAIPVDEVNVNSFSLDGEDVDLGNCTSADPTDGSNGFVWKPNSDTQYYAVVVLPSSLTGSVSSVETYSTAGERIKELTYKGCGNDDAGGPRCAYQDYSLTGSDYKNQYGSIVLKVNRTNGQCLSYFLSNPAQRID